MFNWFSRFRPSGGALLIDAENVAPLHAGEISEAARRVGVLQASRVYGDWSKPNLAKWHSIAQQSGLKPVQQFSPNKKKNAVDIAMAIEAVELRRRYKLSFICLASNDADFTPLATHLRSHGVAVHGFGTTFASRTFSNACDHFTTLGEPLPSFAKSSKLNREVVLGLVEIVRTTAEADGWSLLSKVGSRFGAQPAFHPSLYGFKKVEPMLRAAGGFRFRKGEDGTTVYVAPAGPTTSGVDRSCHIG